MDLPVTMAVAQHESGFNSQAVGSHGEVGVFQVRPQYIAGYTKDELVNPEINIMVGISLLKEAKDKCIHKKRHDWLVCYNLGRSGAKRILYPSLFSYVLDVERIMLANNLRETYL